MTTRRGGSTATPVDEPLDVSTMDPNEGMEVDFSVVKEFEPVETDRPYNCILTKLDWGKSGAGHAKAIVEYTVVEPSFFADRIIQTDFSLQPQARYRLFNMLAALGEDPDKMKEPGFKVIPSNYLGTAAVVYARNEVYDEQTRSKIRRVAPAASWTEVAWEPSEDPNSSESEEGTGDF